MGSECEDIVELTTRHRRWRRMTTVLKEGWQRLARLTIEVGLWANPGGRFSDLSDIKAKLAVSKAIRKHSVLPVSLELQNGAQGEQIVKAHDPISILEQPSAFADTALTVILQPLLRGCEALEKMGEIPLSTQCSRVVVQFMLHILVMLSQVPRPRWRVRKAQQNNKT